MEKSFWKKVINSFDPEFFKEIVHQPLRQSFKYLLFLLLILTPILSFRYTIDTITIMKDWAKKFSIFCEEELKDVPEITIEKGRLISPKKLFSKEWKEFIFIIDPKGEVGYYLDLIKNHKKSGVIILENKIIISLEEHEVTVRDFEKISYLNLKFDEEEREKLFVLTLNGEVFRITPKGLNYWLDLAPFILFPLSLILIFLALWIVKLIHVFIFSLFSLMINGVGKVGLNYKSLLNIGIFALTPPLIFKTFVKLTNIFIPHFTLVYLILYAIFLISGILKCRPKEPVEFIAERYSQ